MTPAGFPLYDRILVPLDGSPTAEAILPHVCRLAPPGAEVLLARVVEITPAFEGLDLTAIHERDRAEAHRYIHERVRDLEAKGIRGRGVVREGATVATLARLAEHEGAGLIALSTHGRTGLSRWIFGSVTQELVRSSPIPILVVRPAEGAADAAGAPPGRILVPLDGSARSSAAVPYAEALARRFEAEIVLLSVRELSVPTVGAAYAEALEPGRRHEEGEEASEVAAQDLARKGVRARALVWEGDPAARILDAGRASSVDLIVMATHGRSGLARWTLGSVTETVLRAATVPVLVVPRAGSGGEGKEGDERAA
jgi:nucleotide-binding universal stress UspA family protein